VRVARHGRLADAPVENRGPALLGNHSAICNWSIALLPESFRAIRVRMATSTELVATLDDPELSRISSPAVYFTWMVTGTPGIQAELIWIVAAPGPVPEGTRKFTW
jgi:hypothetical protein